MKSISVVIPNYNGKDLLKRNLPHVYRALDTSGITDYEIIVADDYSKDGSVEFLLKEFPGVLVIAHPGNFGFAVNTNSGIFASSKDLVLVLNSDVELTEGFFIPLLHYFDRPNTFGVMSRIIALDSDHVQDGAKYPDYSYARIGSTTNYRSSEKSSLYTMFLSGANALIDRQKLLELGGFDEMFSPYYAEDVDLGLRAWKVGYRCYYDDTAYCRHSLSETIQKETPAKVRTISKRNKMYLHYVHLDGSEQKVYLALLAIKAALRAMLSQTVYVQAYQEFKKMIDEADRARDHIREIQEHHQFAMSMKDIRATILASIGDAPITKF